MNLKRRIKNLESRHKFDSACVCPINYDVRVIYPGGVDEPDEPQPETAAAPARCSKCGKENAPRLFTVRVIEPRAKAETV